MEEMIIDGVKVSSADTFRVDLGIGNSSNGIYIWSTNKYRYYSEMAKECKIAIRKNNKKKFIKMMRYQIRGYKGKDPAFDSSFLDFENYRRIYLKSLKPFTFEWEENHNKTVREFMNEWIEIIERENKPINMFSTSIDPASKIEDYELLVNIEYLPGTFGETK